MSLFTWSDLKGKFPAKPFQPHFNTLHSKCRAEENREFGGVRRREEREVVEEKEGRGAREK